MKFIAIGDLHFSIYLNEKFVGKLSELLRGIKETFENVIEFAKENKINTIIIVGDIFHNKSSIHTVAQGILLDTIRTNKDIHFIVIDGNHDLSSKTADGVSALKCLDSEENVKMIHETTIIDNVLFVPWSTHIGQDIKENDAKYLVSHFGLNEAELSSGISIVADLKASDLSKFHTCILGHYHKPQLLETSTTRIYYVGSLIQLDWGEKNEEKRFLIVDTETDEIESIPSVGYKQYHKLVITEDNKTELCENARQLIAEGHHVILEKFDNFDTDVLNEEFLIVNKSEIDITNRGITTSMSMADKLSKYLDVKDIPEELRAHYISVSLEIIENCAEVEE